MQKSGGYVIESVSRAFRPYPVGVQFDPPIRPLAAVPLWAKKKFWIWDVCAKKKQKKVSTCNFLLDPKK